MTWVSFAMELVAALAAVVAAIYAAKTLRFSRREARRAADARVHERKTEFELSIVKSLIETLEEPHLYAGPTAAKMTPLVKMLDPQHLPRLRAAIDLEPTTDEARHMVESKSMQLKAEEPGVSFSKLTGAHDVIAEELHTLRRNLLAQHPASHRIRRRR